MYSDFASLKIAAKAIIELDESILEREPMLDSRLFYFALGIINESPEIFRMITLGERQDIPIVRLGEAILNGDPTFLEEVRSNSRIFNLGMALLKNEFYRLKFLANDKNYYNFSLALVSRNTSYLNQLDNSDVVDFLNRIEDIHVDGLKNVIWDESFILKCLKCSEPILPDSFGYLHYYFSSNEDKRVMNTMVYFKEVFRHRFYKFCSKECCREWVNPPGN
jgi:hypothetical protein